MDIYGAITKIQSLNPIAFEMLKLDCCCGWYYILQSSNNLYKHVLQLYLVIPISILSRLNNSTIFFDSVKFNSDWGKPFLEEYREDFMNRPYQPDKNIRPYCIELTSIAFKYQNRINNFLMTGKSDVCESPPPTLFEIDLTTDFEIDSEQQYLALYKGKYITGTCNNNCYFKASNGFIHPLFKCCSTHTPIDRLWVIYNF
jgi:hypothetical protein